MCTMRKRYLGDETVIHSIQKKKKRWGKNQSWITYFELAMFMKSNFRVILTTYSKIYERYRA